MSDAWPVQREAWTPTESAGCDNLELDAVRDQRSGQRYTLLIRTAKLTCDAGEFLCVVRDVSREGVKIRVFHPLPAGAGFAIDLGSGESHAVVKVWEKGDLAGFRFVQPVALDELLADAPDGLKRRAMRLRLELPLVIHAHGEAFEATFVDISQHGAGIQCDDHLAMDERVRLTCKVLPELTAKVRWRRKPLYGLIFEQTFRFDELARLIAPLRLRSPR